MPGDILTLEQVAELLQVNRRTIYRLVREGKIPAFKVGKQWRFKKEAIDKWTERQSQFEEKFSKLLTKLRNEGEMAGITEKDVEQAIAQVRKMNAKSSA